jgi:lipid II:glycine glycyltransferase (peptidoglycan interpeptide bridge formation enzyme)
MPIVSIPEWKAFLQGHPDAHLLQTAEWGELKSAFGWETVRLIRGDTGVQILIRKLPLGFTIAYVPKPLRGGAVLAPGQALLDEANGFCRRQHAVLLKIEPDAWDAPAGNPPWKFSTTDDDLRVSPHNIQPPRTIIVDLRGSEEDVLARMRQKCRYNVRLAVKKGIGVRAWDDLDGFHRMMAATGGRDGFGVHSLEYYRRAYDLFHPAGMAELLVAEFEGRPLAALMVFARGKRAWYLFGASTDEERNRMPTYLLQWEAMRWAKAQGCEDYDLWGVPDEDETALEAGFENRSDGLWGVYRFKRGFGGQVRRAVQAVDRVYNPLLYRLYLWRFASESG